MFTYILMYICKYTHRRNTEYTIKYLISTVVKQVKNMRLKYEKLKRIACCHLVTPLYCGLYTQLFENDRVF